MITTSYTVHLRWGIVLTCVVCALLVTPVVCPGAAAKDNGAEKTAEGDDAEKQEVKVLPPPRDERLKGVTPSDTLVLWHTYNGSRHDILDFSGHGSLGEFLTAPRIPTRDSRDYGLRFLGDWKSGKAFGYRIMESDALTLKEGTIGFWVWIDGHYTKDGTIIISEADKKRKITVKAKGDKFEIRSSLTGGTLLKGKSDKPGWNHIAVTFDSTGSKLWLNGKVLNQNKVAGALDDSKGFWVGNDGNGKKGFAGTLDDLKVYNKALTQINDASRSPESVFPPSGFVLHYDFQDIGENGIAPLTIKDRSGNKLDGQCDSIFATGFKVKDKNAPNKNDMAWEFKQNITAHTASKIVLPVSDALDLPQGTMMLYFSVKHMTCPGDPRAWFMGIDEGDGGHGETEMDLYQYHPNNFATLDPKKVEPFYLIGPVGRSQNKPRIPYAAHIGEWIKLVISWDSRGVNIWLNNMRLKKNLGRFRLYGNKGFISLGARSPNDFDCLNGYISDFKIYSYKLTAYARSTIAGADEKSWRAPKPPEFKLLKREKDDLFTNDADVW